MLTEIGLAAVVAIRAGKTLEWDGEKIAGDQRPEATASSRTEWAGEVDGV